MQTDHFISIHTVRYSSTWMHICCSNHSISTHVHSYWIIQHQWLHKALWFLEKSDLGGLLHLHQTHAAVARNGQPFMVTESGDFYSCSSTCLEQRITFSNNTLQDKVLKSQKLRWLKYFPFYNCWCSKRQCHDWSVVNHISPCCNRKGWPGVKHKVTYLLVNHML